VCYKMCRPGLGPPVVTGAHFPTGTVTGDSFLTDTAYRTVKLTATLNPVPLLRMCAVKPSFPRYLCGVLLIKYRKKFAFVCNNYTIFNAICVLVSNC
jgi:hypothetical protein